MPSSTRSTEKSTSFSRPERRVVHCVEADRDPVEARVLERLRLAREQGRVRREGDLDVELREHLDQPLDIPTKQRLTAGEAELAHAERDRGTGNACQLVEVEQLLAVEESVTVAEDLLRHAVRATEVATICDRDPEVPKWTTEGVEDLRHL